MKDIKRSSGDTPLFQTYDTQSGEYHAILCGEDIKFNGREDRFDFIMEYLELAEIAAAKCR